MTWRHQWTCDFCGAGAETACEDGLPAGWAQISVDLYAGDVTTSDLMDACNACCKRGGPVGALVSLACVRARD